MCSPLIELFAATQTDKMQLVLGGCHAQDICLASYIHGRNASSEYIHKQCSTFIYTIEHGHAALQASCNTAMSLIMNFPCPAPYKVHTI